MTEHNRDDHKALIERGVEALAEDAWVGHSDELTRDDLAMIVQRVWTVFEQAHAPTSTDDEREAEGWREAEAYADDHDPSKRAETADDYMSGWRAADRLRRTVTPEPSAKPTFTEALAHTPTPEGCPGIGPQGEPSDERVRAVWDALGPGITVAFEYEELHAALRVAFKMRGEGR